MLIVNVDGFGYGGSLALEPGFIPMIEKLQVGGVIPHYGSTDYQRIRRTNRALAAMTEQPLLICCDIVKIASPLARPGASPKIARFGDGYVGGFIGRFRGLPDEDFRRLAMLNAFTFWHPWASTSRWAPLSTTARATRGQWTGHASSWRSWAGSRCFPC